jgi:pimeloyl-CoA synthetase
MDPRGVGTVTVELNNTAAQLLAKLCVELSTDDATGVISRALGLMEMSLRAKRRGARLCFVSERGELSDVVL